VINIKHVHIYFIVKLLTGYRWPFPKLVTQSCTARPQLTDNGCPLDRDVRF